MRHFERVSDSPLLGLDAVPWAAPKVVQKGGDVTQGQKEVRATIMHPSVIALDGRFLMYYAPHHSAGIGAATAERIEGPWTPVDSNPLLTLEQFPGLTNHISGPDVVYHPVEKQWVMYLHGSTEGAGQQTGVATSTDALQWTPRAPGPILQYPYLRAFRHRGQWLGIVRMGNAIGLVCSKDGFFWRDWCGGRLLRPEDEHHEYDRIRHYCVRVVDDTLFLYYCTYTRPDLSRESIKLATMDLSGEARSWGKPQRLGAVLEPELPWEADNLRDPYLIEVDGTLYMFYVGGNESGIALAREAGG